jgi:Tfp pilus assembly protein PilV
MEWRSLETIVNQVVNQVNQRGLSLVEIPVALLVVAIVIICAMRTSRTAGSVQRDSHMGNQATSYGMAKLNQFEAYPSSKIVAGQDVVVNALGNSFTRTWSVTDKSSGKEVNVVISWTSASRTESLTLATILR